MRDTVAVCCGNQKGGVGKTTLVLHLAVALARLFGLRVLVWDLDPTHGLTSHLGLPGDLPGSFEVLSGRIGALEGVCLACARDLPIDVIPSSRLLGQLDDELSRDPYARPWQSLHRPLREVRGARRWDLVLLDTPPSLSTPTRCAYLEADAVIAAATPTPGALEGLVRLLDDLNAVQSRDDLNPDLALVGVVLGDVDRRMSALPHLRDAIRERLAKAGCPEALCRTQVPTSAALSRAWAAGRSLFDQPPRARRTGALAAFEALAHELGPRLGLECTAAQPPARA